jgi:hypothetical protein
MSIVVNQTTQTITFTQPTSPVNYGVSPITLVATGGASGNPVTFSIASGGSFGSLSGTNNSVLTITGAGTIVIAANQAGDTNYAAATAVQKSIIVNQATPGITLAASVNPILVQSAITFTATVTSAIGTPTGTVIFMDGTTPLGTGTMVNGVTTFTTSTLAVGAHAITAVYSGDSNFVIVTSSALTETVLDFSVSFSGGAGSSGTASVTSATVQPGGTAVFIVTISPVGSTTFPSTITLSVSGLPAGATYVISPATLLAGSVAQTVTLTVQLPATTAALHHEDGMNRFAPFALALLLLPFAGRMRKQAKRLSRMTWIMLLLIASVATIAGLNGCGGNDYFAQQPTTYTVTMTATSGNQSSSTPLTLTVE